VYKGLPAAVLMNNYADDPYDGSNLGPNWAVLLLPYLEQTPLYNSVSASIKDWMRTTGDATDNTWRNIRGNTVSLFLCPSDGKDTLMTRNFMGVSGWARGNYAANCGPHYHFGSRPDGGSSSGGPWGYPGQGPFSCWRHNSKKIGMKIANILDGSSNTILFAEIRAGVDANDTRGLWAFGLAGHSLVMSHADGDCELPNDPGSCSDDIRDAADLPAIGLGNWTSCNSNQATSRSLHTGGVNVAMGDGTVRFVAETISHQDWWKINASNDGNPTPSF